MAGSDLHANSYINQSASHSDAAISHMVLYPVKTVAALSCYILSWFQASYQIGILPNGI